MRTNLGRELIKFPLGRKNLSWWVAYIKLALGCLYGMFLMVGWCERAQPMDCVNPWQVALGCVRKVILRTSQEATLLHESCLQVSSWSSCPTPLNDGKTNLLLPMLLQVFVFITATEKQTTMVLKWFKRRKLREAKGWKNKWWNYETIEKNRKILNVGFVLKLGREEVSVNGFFLGICWGQVKTQSRKRCLSGPKVMINIYRNRGRSRLAWSSCKLASLRPINTRVNVCPWNIAGNRSKIWISRRMSTSAEKKKQNRAKDKNYLLWRNIRMWARVASPLSCTVSSANVSGEWKREKKSSMFTVFCLSLVKVGAWDNWCLHVFVLEMMLWNSKLYSTKGWRDGLEVQKALVFLRGPRFGSHQPYGVSQLPLTPVSYDFMPSSSHQELQTHM